MKLRIAKQSDSKILANIHMECGKAQINGFMHKLGELFLRTYYYVLLKENGIQITNSKFSFAKSLHPKAYDMIINNIHAHMEENRQILEDKLFVNETNMLNTVLTSL